MIPRIIHYCWFGRNPKPELVINCIDSWKKYCPEYEIIEWNEDNFDLNYNDYVREAYESKKWAFVADVVRLKVLHDIGGIYMDIDVEAIKSLDSLLNYEAVSGFQSKEYINTGLIGSEKGNQMIYELLLDYDGEHFVRADGSMNLTTNVIRITNICRKYGLEQNDSIQTVNTFTVLPRDYLCPKDYDTNKLTLTENTLCIHHFNGSWLSEEARFVAEIRRKIKVPGRGHLATFIGAAKFRGIKTAIEETKEWIRKKRNLNSHSIM